MNRTEPSPELTAYRWHRRLLLLFAPDRLDPSFRAQQQLLAARASDLEERELILFELLGDAGRGDGRELSAAEVARLRERYGVAPEAFVLVLVGKDGTPKRREAEVTAPDDLFAQIDGMPMRLREMGGGEA